MLVSSIGDSRFSLSNESSRNYNKASQIPTYFHTAQQKNRCKSLTYSGFLP
ncbi:MAG: hypothetical protein ACI84D_003670 [Thalassolituus oleivorans]|jgi:hypothetical protein